VLTRARSEYKPDLVWCPAVINLDDSREYCGPARIFPMPWMLYTSREALIAAGGWDENLLRGFSYDDNDIAGRLVLVTRGFIGDWNHIVWHQSHPNPMIGDSTYIDNGVWENKTYVREKWNGGIPFGLDDPFTVVAESYGGYTPLEFKHRCDSSTIIGRTLSPFVERA
jgi:hypothetical protein